MKSVIIGATGAVGREILKESIAGEYYSHVYAFGRESVTKLPKAEKFTPVVVDFSNLDFDLNILEGADIYCALGTTLKQAGSKERQYEIDYTYIINFAKICEGRVRSFNVVSSVGATIDTRNFYLKTKGEVEEKLTKMDLGKIRIYRPSLLLAERDDNRVLESLFIKLTKRLSPYFKGLFGKYTPVKPNILAKTMLFYAEKDNDKCYYSYRNFLK